MKKILILLSILSLTSCVSLEKVANSRGQGQSKTYDQPYDLVWDSAVRVINNSELELVSKDKSRNLILAKRSMLPITTGERVAIYIEKTESPNRTKVEVISKKAIMTDMFAKDWTGYLLENLDAKLK